MNPLKNHKKHTTASEDDRIREVVARAAIVLNNKAVDLLLHNPHSHHQDATVMLKDALHFLQQYCQKTEICHMELQTALHRAMQCSTSDCLSLSSSSALSRTSPTRRVAHCLNRPIRELTEHMSAYHHPAAAAWADNEHNNNSLFVIRLCDLNTLQYTATEIQTATLIHNLGMAHLISATEVSCGEESRYHYEQALHLFPLAIHTLEHHSHSSASTWCDDSSSSFLMVRQKIIHQQASVQAHLYAAPHSQDVQQQNYFLQSAIQVLNHTMYDLLGDSRASAAA